MNSGVYIIQNIINGKIYVGSTTNLINRKYDHFSDLRKNKHDNPHLQSSFNKYGEKNFKYCVVAWCPKNELLKKEDFYINYFHSMDQTKGYNLVTAERHNITEEQKKKISDFMKQNHPMKGKRHSEESKLKIANSVKISRRDFPHTIKHTEETKKKISLKLRGINNPNYHKPMSEEQKKKMSEALKRSPRSNLGKPMSEEQKIKISNSLKNRSKTKGIPKSEGHKYKISLALIGDKNPNYHKPMSERQKVKISESLKKYYRNNF